MKVETGQPQIRRIKSDVKFQTIFTYYLGPRPLGRCPNRGGSSPKILGQILKYLWGHCPIRSFITESNRKIWTPYRPTFFQLAFESARGSNKWIWGPHAPLPQGITAPVPQSPGEKKGEGRKGGGKGMEGRERLSPLMKSCIIRHYVNEMTWLTGDVLCLSTRSHINRTEEIRKSCICRYF